MFAAAAYMDLRRLPELFCGFLRRQHNSPTLYPVACSPQAWASATVLALVQALLGLELCDAKNEIGFFRPQLPYDLDELHVRNLKLARGTADVLIRRRGEEVAVTQTRREGDVSVVVRY
jgi:glycogen debranching enzyme